MPEDILKRLVHAACAVYRVGDRLPADDPLTRMLKEAALTTTASCVVFFCSPEGYNERKAHGDIDTLRTFFVVAKNQDWLDPRNFSVLLEEYLQLKEEIREFRGKQAERENESKRGPLKEKNERNEAVVISNRQKKILAYAKDHLGEEISLKQVRDMFPDVAYRTVQRDIQMLLDIGLIGKKGTTHNTTYHLEA